MVEGVSASHVTVLTLIPKYFHITKVLEIGSGNISTPLFLNKSIFPKLKELVSVEENKDWFLKTYDKFSKDERFKLLPSVPASIYNYDLIFIDGPQSAVRRSKVISFIMREVIKPIIVIHDIENKMYKRQVNTDFNSFVFTFIKSPMTGVYSHEVLPNKALAKLNRVMHKHFDEIQEDSERWKELLK